MTALGVFPVSRVTDSQMMLLTPPFSVFLQGADVNCMHGTLKPLHCACMVADADCIEMLLEKGAEVGRTRVENLLKSESHKTLLNVQSGYCALA